MEECLVVSKYLVFPTLKKKKKEELSEIRYMKPWLPIHIGELQRDTNMNFLTHEMEKMALTLSHRQFILSTVWWVFEFNRFDKSKRKKQ